MTERPFILITNDDGVHATGIKHLWQAVQGMADLAVVAPAGEQSAVSLSITVRHPLHIAKVEWATLQASTWSVNGTPADCVKLALNVILPRRPQLILSGINRGTNAGRNVLYSGTVAAVMEGVMHGIPGIAFSLGDYFNPTFGHVESFIALIVDYALKHPLPDGTFLNVNFPKSECGPIKGVRLTNQGKEYWAENPEERHHPAENHPYYWLGSKLAQFDEQTDCDITWLKKGYATAVPIQIGDLTSHKHIAAEKQNFESFVNLS
ncbi:5'-nucleotidase [Candidatus Protochlamydia naegleriophila]|uniref:5'-nucleotidase SurE n=1 Tax=Candidatus Protochlamydia naegleriophila TaxID=389348 RepID=A0A0U5JCX2_9BACT|nr:5'/3'-nucleotidase SurE [Candidatus Protochlamydia naegleriophila]CUI16957.1 5'-nucleotidase [Candidatus Protochlamydia naegleriophila]